MPRGSEFAWSGAPRRRLWPLGLIGLGLAACYLFISPSGEPATVMDPGTPSALADRKETHNEPSDLASAAPYGQPELAQNEASAIASARAGIEVINAPPTDTSQRAIPAPRIEHQESSASPDYAALRREMLRHLP